MKTLLLILSFLSIAWTASSQSANAVISDYLHLKDVLVASDPVKAGEAAAKLSASVASAGDFKQKPALEKQLKTLAALKDLEKQRAAFAPLSELVYAYAQNAPHTDPLYYQYCPMKKSHWLSAESEIRNPYYGSKMLACGSVKETLPKQK